MSLPPSRTADKIMIRLPEGMRDQLAAAAERSGLSMNAEVVRRLAKSFEESADQQNLPDLVDLRRKMDARFLEIDQQAEERRVLLDTAMEELGRTFGQEFLDRVYAKAQPLIDKRREGEG